MNVSAGCASWDAGSWTHLPKLAQHRSCDAALETSIAHAGPRTQPSALRLSNNRIQDPNEQLPDTPWQFFFWGMNDCCRFEGDWCQEGEHRYPNDKAWTNRRENKVFFDFEGSEVGLLCP